MRRNFNATPIGEPVEPAARRMEARSSLPSGQGFASRPRRIHPAIGIARAREQCQEYFIGPEIIDPPPEKPGFYRDGQGALKRQAARFRIYGFNAAGEIVRELTATDANICWTVHVANHKAAWYQWTMALDVEEAKGSQIPRRNSDVVGDQRQRLVIDGGPKSISGRKTQGLAYEFRGQFQGTDVYLGELRTDDDGRLLFLGGRGKSGYPSGSTILPGGPNGFINADGWYDDMSDGPVIAKVWIEDEKNPGGIGLDRNGTPELRSGPDWHAHIVRSAL